MCGTLLFVEKIKQGLIEALSILFLRYLSGRSRRLLAGVQTHAPDSFTDVKTGSASGRPYVNGQREQSNNFMLDGVDQNEAVDNLIAYYPSPDAVAEMRLETNNYSAEYGNVAGGVITAVTKSGTNEYHGSAFIFGRNDSLDANSWSNNKSEAKKGNFTQQIFGGTFGTGAITEYSDPASNWARWRTASSASIRFASASEGAPPPSRWGTQNSPGGWGP
jgi:hypothetical protein